jgi:WD40 repeat protein
MNGTIYFDGYANDKNEIRSWDVKTGRESRVVEGSSPSFATNANMNRQMVYRNIHGNGVMIGKKNLRLDAPKMDEARISPDGKLLAVAEGPVGGVDLVVLFDRTGKRVASTENVRHPVWHPDPKEKSLLLLGVDYDTEESKGLFRWDTRTKPKPLGTKPRNVVAGAMCLKNGMVMLAYTEQDANNIVTISLCPLPEYTKGKPSVVLAPKDQQKTMGLCFSPDGSYLATWTQDTTQYTLTIIKIATRRRVSVNKPPRHENPFGILVWI